MNPDNPYAAPQTSLHQPTAELPVAEPATGPWERRLFPECATEQLQLLAAHSRAIADMRWVWLFPLFLETISGAVILNFPAADSDLLPMLIWLALFLLTLLRIGASFFRWKPLRIFFLICDGPLTAATMIGTVVSVFSLLRQLAFVSIFPIAIFGLMSLLGWRACKATVLAPELFAAGKFPHALLIQEDDYRRKYRIP